MKLNLGCGDRYVRGWVNVDFGSPHRADERVDLTAPGPLPWPEGSVSHVYAGHVFEHLTRQQCLDLSQRLLRCMDPRGGLLVVVGPDMAVAREMAVDGTLDTTHHSLDSIIHGGSRWPGDEHKWETTGTSVCHLLSEAGWPIARQFPIGAMAEQWPIADPEPPWQFFVRAYTGEMT